MDVPPRLAPDETTVLLGFRRAVRADVRPEVTPLKS